MGGTAAMPKDAEKEFAGLSVSEAIKRTGTSVAGLKQTEAENRLAQYGYNELIERKESPIIKFLSYFKGPIPGMIMAAAVISGVLRHWPDLGVILGLLIMNAVVGFREEYQADNTIASLKENLAVKAKVKRDGKWKVIPARELVPGDIVRLRIGDIIPADAKLRYSRLP